MSYNSLVTQTQDQGFLGRLDAAVYKEAWTNPTFGDTDYGQATQRASTGPRMQFAWPVAIDTEAAYETALLNNVPNPGTDPSVITDGQILSAVQAHWPPDPWPPPLTPAATGQTS
jgi:hypothetical protein